MNTVFTSVASIVFAIIAKLSYVGLLLLMALESCNIPIPSELIMPYAGYLSYSGHMNLHVAALMGAIGCTIGSLVSYMLGYYGGRPFVEKYGKYLLLTKHDIDLGDKLFAKYGERIVLFSRVLPIIRTFISFPAGIAKMNVKKFLIYSFLGSWIWSYLLLFVGEKIGNNQAILGKYFHKFDLAIELVLLLALVFYIYMHIKKLRKA